MTRPIFGGTPTRPLRSVTGNERLTWGVELEFVFAFREEALEELLKRRSGRRGDQPEEIITRVPVEMRRYRANQIPGRDDFTKIPDSDLPNHAYFSWGLRNPGEEIRPYSDEPRTLLDEKIKRKAGTLPTHTSGPPQEREKTNNKYNKWIVSDDPTVPGVGPRNVYLWLPEQKKHWPVHDSWDSFGMELISPVFETDSERNGGRASVSQILDAVNADERNNHAFITNQCGLHVHIGDPPGFTLPDLRMLAILLLVYEENLCGLHVPVRHTTHRVAYNNIESNRYGAYAEKNRDAAMWQQRFGGDSLDSRRNRQKSDLHTMRFRREFKYISANLVGDVQAFDLSDLVKTLNYPTSAQGPRINGDRRRQVNFTPLLRRGQTQPQTIEFRTARGTLNADEVFRWVDLCLGLVRLAKYYARHPEAFPTTGFHTLTAADGNSARNRVNAFDLLHLMGIDQAGIRYWEGQKAYADSVLDLPTAEKKHHVDWRSDLEDEEPEVVEGTAGSSPPPAPRPRRFHPRDPPRDPPPNYDPSGGAPDHPNRDSPDVPDVGTTDKGAGDKAEDKLGADFTSNSKNYLTSAFNSFFARGGTSSGTRTQLNQTPTKAATKSKTAGTSKVSGGLETSGNSTTSGNPNSEKRRRNAEYINLTQNNYTSSPIHLSDDDQGTDGDDESEDFDYRPRRKKRRRNQGTDQSESDASSLPKSKGTKSIKIPPAPRAKTLPRNRRKILKPGAESVTSDKSLRSKNDLAVGFAELPSRNDRYAK